MNQGLLDYLGRQGKEVSDRGKELGRLLAANDFESFAERLGSFFAGIPYQWQGGNGPSRYEAWYAAMLYVCFTTIGLDLRAEDSSSRGRSDMVVLHSDQVFVLEFKMAEPETDAGRVLDRAMAQIREKDYGEKYRDRGEPIHHLAICFGKTERNLIGIRTERG